jgi:hypothetical protein
MVDGLHILWIRARNLFQLLKVGWGGSWGTDDGCNVNIGNISLFGTVITNPPCIMSIS